MNHPFKGKGFAIIVIAILLTGGIAYAGLEFTSTMSFCQSCHIMEYAYISWSEAKHSNHVESCADCHLPKAFAPKVEYKISSGTSDFYKNLAGFSGSIKIKEKSKKIVLDNCKRCHEKFLASGEHPGGKKPKECFSCHKSAAHKRSIIEKH